MAKKSNIDQEIEKEAEKEKLRIKKQDDKEKKKGATFKVVAWIHPEFGDDRCIDIYFKGRNPSDAQIQKYLKKEGSEILTDYRIVEL